MSHCQECYRAQLRADRQDGHHSALCLVVGLVIAAVGAICVWYGYVYGWGRLNDGGVYALAGALGVITIIVSLWWLLLPYVSLTIVGCYLYEYVNHGHKNHTHLTPPEYRHSATYEDGAIGPVFRYKLGGWFKRDGILNQRSDGYWRIRRASGQEHVACELFYLLDPNGGRLPPMPLADLRWIVACFSGLHTLVSFAREAERQRDHLGSVVFATIAFALASKSAQKSPTAGAMRAMLEDGLRSLPAHRYGGHACSDDLLALWQRSAAELVPTGSSDVPVTS